MSEKQSVEKVVVTDCRSRTVKTYTLTVQDGPVLPQRYSRPGKRYKVERIEVTKQDGNISRVVLAGHSLKKDGTAGAVWHAETSYIRKDWPGWLHSIAAGLA